MRRALSRICRERSQQRQSQLRPVERSPYEGSYPPLRRLVGGYRPDAHSSSIDTYDCLPPELIDSTIKTHTILPFGDFNSNPQIYDSIPTCSLSTPPSVPDLPGPQDQPSVLLDLAVTEGIRAQAELSSVWSEAESGRDVDALEELDAAVTAESCSVTNTLPTHPQIQTCSSGPARTEGVSGSLAHSHSSPSLSHVTSAENRTLTRACSLPKLLLKSSCEQFTPDITADEDQETYRFLCSCSGLYQCSVTGLVFHMEREGEVVYRTVPWDRRLLSHHHKRPAGPLFDIKCEQQSVCQLHLPHCEIRSTGGAQFLRVAHVDEEGMEFIDPHKITETHVVINISGFSAYGNVKDGDSPPDPVRALVLLFYRPPADPDPSSLLNVLLLPRNVAFRDVLRYRKKLDGDERYIETSPHCKLRPQQDYSLSTCPEDDSVLVEPTTAEFDADNYDNYFPSFQVTLETPLKHLKLVLRDSSHSVWERRVCLSSSGVQRSWGQSAQNLKPDQSLFDIRISFLDGVSEPVLKTLLDKLFEKKVMSDSERESVDEMRNRRDKACVVIDTVRRKGEAASSEMIQALCELDPFFSEHLGLM
ncbi:NACHT, LRR and PYD domains-containing protein 1b allele 3-like [Notolabrus celidotus]|uniref:NACHT, LRR and PYD domains-containing protein 1b allele 3-like n=1 Tax=Notolabrus celidotus TaxID=1203425 RepID=UPI00148F848B|nr:NACHT, LRR and PYD domains-containing protein 1b allele 3-like [Notolabrus celidotus]